MWLNLQETVTIHIRKSVYMEFKEVKLGEWWSSHCCCVNSWITWHLRNNGNNHNVSNRQRGSMVDSSMPLSIIRLTYRWKVAVEWCMHYLGQHSITWTLSCKEGAIKWESNRNLPSECCLYNRYSTLSHCFGVDTSQEHVLVILTIKKPLFKVMTSVRGLLLIGVEDFPNSTTIR